MKAHAVAVVAQRDDGVVVLGAELVNILHTADDRMCQRTLSVIIQKGNLFIAHQPGQFLDLRGKGTALAIHCGFPLALLCISIKTQQALDISMLIKSVKHSVYFLADTAYIGTTSLFIVCLNILTFLSIMNSKTPYYCLNGE